jgi:hypothetical protein
MALVVGAYEGLLHISLQQGPSIVYYTEITHTTKHFF